MIHIMEVATMNAHEIGQMEVEGETNWLLAQTKPVGCALEPTLVLLNHSCDPTLLRVNIGTATLCFASRDLAAGEEPSLRLDTIWGAAPRLAQQVQVRLQM